MTAVAIFVVGWFVISAIDEHRKAQTRASDLERAERLCDPS